MKSLSILALLISWLCLTFNESSRAEIMPIPPKKVFTFRVRDEPETLDWNKARTIVESYILTNIMEGLVTFDSTSHIYPSLAQSWSISSDGKTYTFKLRPGVKWSDGIPLKAQDFVYSWRRLLSPLTAAAYNYILFDIEGAEDFSNGKLTDFTQVGIKAVDDLTLQVKLAQPVAHWIYIPAFWVTFPMRQDIVEKYGSGWETPGRMVNLGPYSLETHDIDSKITMKANPSYYGVRGNVDQIVASIVKDDLVALSMYERGQLDFLTDVAAVDLRKFSGRTDLKTLPHLKTGYLGFVVDKYPLSITKLRRAIAMSIDKVKLAASLHGGQEPATSFIPPTMMAYSKAVGLPFNITKAKAELAASGYSGEQININYLLPNWDKAKVIGEYIKNELKKNLGIQVSTQYFDNKAYRTQLSLHAFSLFDMTWTADYPDPDDFLSLFQSGSINSDTTWKNASFDALVQQARRSQNPKEREKLYLDTQKILLEDEAVIIPLYYEPNLVFVKPYVKNFELNSLDYLYLRKVTLGR